MINNNPYNSSERTAQKSGSKPIIQEQYRKHDAIEPPSKLSSPSQYVNRNRHPPLPTSASSLKKSSVNLDQTLPSYRPSQPTVPVKHFLPSPKNNPSFTSSNASQINNLQTSRGHIGHNSPIERRENVNQVQLRESFGITIHDSKQMNEKIELLAQLVEKMDKRIQKLEKEPTTPTKLNETIRKLIEENKHEEEENFNSMNSEICKLKYELSNCMKSYEVDKVVTDKVKSYSETKSSIESITQSYSLSEEALRKQTQVLRVQLQENIRKNYDFLTAVISRIEREMHNMLHPMYKPSALKCSNSAILLRFVQSFRVRKNGTKLGESKIILTDNTYYIDHEGFLLDKDQHYLVDSWGKQVKLQEKHILMLKQEQVLQ